MSTNNGKSNKNGADAHLIPLRGMYKDYFLDYASYVILERAVPAGKDGVKPVQRRIMHAMRNMHDGRYHKVANIIGQTMQFHPHGDAAIGDALVKLGQKDLLIDCQGNWGDIRTGDGAAAPRYIEARLTKFALDVAFNPQTTEWQLSYDGRKKEPIHLPMKFPLLLTLGAEGIAVGLSTRILPHNFIEITKGAIKILQGKKVKLLPDFQTGGMMDASDYNNGKRGGRVKVRARMEQLDKKQLAIRELPYGVTTDSLIDSILKANDKGKIKIKKVVDNTAAEVEILIDLAPGISPEVTMDALYAFTNCEISISPNACVIIDDKPIFLSVNDLLEASTEQTRELLRMELEIKKKELEEKWHFASLEKIFIQNRIYHEIEEAETWEEVLETIERELGKYIVTPSMKAKANDTRLQLMRDLVEEDIIRLTEIKIKRISKYNSFKADEQIAKLEEELAEVEHNLANLTDYAIAWFEYLLDKYGKGRERKTEISTFDAIQAAQVVANNAKLYVNRKDGFIGYGLKKEEFVCDCSDIDDVIIFRRDGKFQVVRISDKVFVGKDILHVDIWKKGDDRTTYNMIYVDAGSGRSMAKRFNVKAITRDREYDLTKGAPNSKVHYFLAHPNGESEVVNIQLTPGCKAKKKVFDFDFEDIAIKGRSSQGNTLTKYPIRKVSQKEVGQSTLGAMDVWMDDVSGRLNTDERGTYLGAFDTGDLILAVFNDGSYIQKELDLLLRFEPKELLFIGKFDPAIVISAVHYDGAKGWTMVKRFQIETTSLDQRFSFLTENNKSKLLFASLKDKPRIKYNIKLKSKKMEGQLDLADFISVKGWKAAGNKLSDQRLTGIKEIETVEGAEQEGNLKAGDTIEFDLDDDGQVKMF